MTAHFTDRGDIALDETLLPLASPPGNNRGELEFEASRGGDSLREREIDLPCLGIDWCALQQRFIDQQGGDLELLYIVLAPYQQK